jgi:hypothetical protein
MPVTEILLILAVVCAFLLVILGIMAVLKSELYGPNLFK